MTESPENAGEKQGGRFKPGQSGNPAGKAKGTRHKTTLACEVLLDGEAENLTRKAIEMALGGDGPAMRLCMERIAPPRKDAAVNFSLPPINNAGDVVAASAALLEAVADGEVTPDEGVRIMGLLSAHKSIIEMGDFERRLEALEAKK